MRDYNRVIEIVSRRYGARLINLFDKAAQYSSADLAHPDRDRMAQIANAVIDLLSLI